MHAPLQTAKGDDAIPLSLSPYIACRLLYIYIYGLGYGSVTATQLVWNNTKKVIMVDFVDGRRTTSGTQSGHAHAMEYGANVSVNLLVFNLSHASRFSRQSLAAMEERLNAHEPRAPFSMSYVWFLDVLLYGAGLVRSSKCWNVYIVLTIGWWNMGVILNAAFVSAKCLDFVWRVPLEWWNMMEMVEWVVCGWEFGWFNMPESIYIYVYVWMVPSGDSTN